MPAVPRSVREALVAWDRTLYDVPVVAYPTQEGFIYEKVYDLGGEDAYICDHTIDNNVFIPVRPSSSLNAMTYQTSSCFSRRPRVSLEL